MSNIKEGKGRDGMSQPLIKKHRKNESQVWKDFDVIPAGFSAYPDQRKRAKCKHCGAIVLADGHNGINSMKRHMNSCAIRTRPTYHDVGQMILGSNVSGGPMLMRSTKFEQEKHRENLAMAVVVHQYPYQFVEHRFNRNVHHYLNNDVKHVSRNTTKVDVLKLYKKEEKKLFNLLQLIPGKVCLAVDMWTAVTSDDYITLIAHFIDKDWVLHKRILNFCLMPPPHTGAAIVEKLTLLLTSWNLDKRIFSLTLDNATSNDTFVSVFKTQLRLKDALICGGEFLHMRCCAHVLNLMVQDGLQEIESGISKIRSSVKFINGSQSRKKKFLDCATELSINHNKGLCQDVSTRWNSTFLMIESALYYRNVFCHLALSDTNYVFCPDDTEWDQVEYMCKFLKLFSHFANLFSGSRYPTINLFFHAMWRIQSQLTQEAMNQSLSIRAMISRMQEKFDKYWQDYNMILAIGVILDPRYKMKVVDFAFSKLYGDECKFKVALVREKLYQLFEEYSNQFDEDHTNLSNRTSQQVDEINVENDDPYAMGYEDLFHLEQSELDYYLQEPIYDRKKDLDILQYWKSLHYQYPRLSHMAHDILSIPLTTVASEAAFSSAGRTLDKYRNCLLPENIEALICCRDWLNITDNDDNVNEDFSDRLLQVDLNASTSCQASNELESNDTDDN